MTYPNTHGRSDVAGEGVAIAAHPTREAPRKPARQAKSPPRLAVVLSSWLRSVFLRLADLMLPAHLALLEHAHGFSHAYVLSAIAELGVADALDDSPRTAAELAQVVGCQTEPLHRLLRAAAVFRVVHLDSGGGFTATRFTRVLRTDHPSAARQWCRYIASSSTQAAWSGLASSVRTGENAYLQANGEPMFALFDDHPDEARHFAEGLGGLTLAETPAILAAYPFPAVGTVCDVGGGEGVLLAALCQAKPALNAVLVDRPSVLIAAAARLKERGVDERIALVPGDLFDGFEVEADLYLLKWILHDWDDARATAILRTVTAAMAPGSKLVVIEGALGANQVDPRFSLMDLQMFVVTDGGRERSVEELQNLITAGGLALSRTRRTGTGLVVLEATRQS